MNIEQAIEIYLLKNRKAKRTINNLVKWDENKNIRENADLIGYRNQFVATGFKARYGLKCCTIRTYKPSKKSLTTKAYTILRKSGWSFTDIAKAFGKKRQTIEQGISRRDIIIND